MPAASQPRICERKYLEPLVFLPHTRKQADNDDIACQNLAPLTSDISVIARRCWLSSGYSGWLSCHHGLREGQRGDKATPVSSISLTRCVCALNQLVLVGDILSCEASPGCCRRASFPPQLMGPPTLEIDSSISSNKTQIII